MICIMATYRMSLSMGITTTCVCEVLVSSMGAHMPAVLTDVRGLFSLSRHMPELNITLCYQFPSVRVI